MFVVKVNLSLRSPAWPSTVVEKRSQVDKSALPCSVWKEYASRQASVKTLQTAARGNVQEIPQVIKFKTGVVRSKLLLSGVKVQFNQPPHKLSSSAGQETQKHSKLLVFVLMSNNDKDRQVSCLVT